MARTVIVFMLSLLMVGFVEALAEEGPPGSNAQMATVRLVEYRFEPAQITFRSGKEVILTLVNEGTVVDFQIILIRNSILF
jgi:hypothetical protein